jgi:hypothetical protein
LASDAFPKIIPHSLQFHQTKRMTQRELRGQRRRIRREVRMRLMIVYRDNILCANRSIIECGWRRSAAFVPTRSNLPRDTRESQKHCHRMFVPNHIQSLRRSVSRTGLSRLQRSSPEIISTLFLESPVNEVRQWVFGFP